MGRPTQQGGAGNWLLGTIALFILTVGLGLWFYSRHPVGRPLAAPGTHPTPTVKTSSKPLPGAVITPEAERKALRKKLFGAAKKPKPKDIADIAREARKSLPRIKARYKNGLPVGQKLFVTTSVDDPQGRSEKLSVRVTEWRPNSIVGVIARQPLILTAMHQGDRMEIAERDVIDWTISMPDGSEQGNAVGKFIESHAARTVSH